MSVPTTATASAEYGTPPHRRHPTLHVADFTGADIVVAHPDGAGAAPAGAVAADGASAAHADPIAPATMTVQRFPAADRPLAVATAGDTIYYTTWSSPLGDGAVHAFPRGGGESTAVGSGLQCPVGIAADETAVYVVTFYGLLHVYPHGADPYVIDLSRDFDCPNGMALRDGRLYIVDWMAGGVRTIDSARVDGPGSRPPVDHLVDGGMTLPGRIAFGEDALYITQSGSARGLDGTVERVDLRAPAPRPETVASGLAYPTGIAVHRGTLYVATVDTRSVVAVTADGAAPTPVITGLDAPWGLVL